MHVNTRVDTNPGNMVSTFVLAVVLIGLLWGSAVSAAGAAADTAAHTEAGASLRSDAATGTDEDIHALTLATAVQRALVRAPALTLARFDVEEAAVAFQEAELGQLIGNPRKEYEQALRAVHEAQDAYVDELVQVALQVEEAYHKVLSTGEALVIQTSNQEQAERQFALTRARFEAGLIARQDFLEAELSYEQSLHSLDAGHRQHEDARQALNRLIGLNEDVVAALRDEFPFETWNIDLDAAIAEALAHRAEIARAERDVEQARTQVQQADTPYAAPIELRRAEMALQRAEIQLNQSLNQISAQVRAEWHSLADLQRNVDVAARRDDLALTRVQISRTRYDAGTIALLQLLQDEEAYAKARQDAVAAIWSYNLARARFLRTLGRTELPPLPAPIADYMETWNREP